MPLPFTQPSHPFLWPDACPDPASRAVTTATQAGPAGAEDERSLLEFSSGAFHRLRSELDGQADEDDASPGRFAWLWLNEKS